MPLTVVLVQGNVAQGQKWDQDLAVRIFRHYLDLSAQGRAAGPAVVIWPETSFPGLLDVDDAARQAIAQATGGRRHWSAASASTQRAATAQQPVRGARRRRARRQLYDKWHLVPFGEYIPDWLPLPIMVMPGNGFASGPGPRTLHVPGLPPVGALICYEAIFGGRDRGPRPIARPGW